MNKITLATVKKFIRLNRSKLFISVKSSFDGMTDGIEYYKETNFRAIEDGDHGRNDLGIKYAWFVGQSRDWFSHFENSKYRGIHVSNCCRSFTLAVKK